MKTLPRTLLPLGLILGSALTIASPLLAATNGTDNASNYTSWTSGSNGGTGFTAWTLTNNNDNSSNFAGQYLGDSTVGGVGDVNTNGQSFAEYAHAGNAFANASRNFADDSGSTPVQSTLAVGQTFSIQMAIAYRNGNKGINLADSNGQVFNFNVGGDNYIYTDSNASGATIGSFAYHQDSVFTLSYTQQSATTGMVNITQSSASAGTSATFTDTFNTGNLLGFTLYNSGTSDSSSQNNLYFNNLSLTGVPEPTTWLGGMALMLVGGLTYRRRQSRLA